MGRGSDPQPPRRTPQDTEPTAPESTEGEAEEDGFMTPVQQVAATLAGMRSRQHGDNRGDEEVSPQLFLMSFESNKFEGDLRTPELQFRIPNGGC